MALRNKLTVRQFGRLFYKMIGNETFFYCGRDLACENNRQYYLVLSIW
jgi:hypothetical protein